MAIPSSSLIVVSCIVPVKNGGELLGLCLESILHQEFCEQYEVCVYNDGSTDNTESTIRHYASRFAAKGIRFRHSSRDESGGVGFAKNCAVSLASGRFLCFCDADDVSFPMRLRLLYEAVFSSSCPDLVLAGSRITRDPPESTARFTRWANEMVSQRLPLQIYTSHGPSLVAPSWFVAMKLFNSVGGFNEKELWGFPEDLDFFYRALDLNAVLVKVDESLVLYRYHPGCATFTVAEETIWQIRQARLEKKVLGLWENFTIWSAGKQGKRFYKTLSDASKAKVTAFCDVDAKKLRRGFFEDFDESTRSVRARIPIIETRRARPPLVICVKQDLTNGDLERLIEESRLVEGVDYIHFG